MFISGERGSFSVYDLRQNTQYSGYAPDDPYIGMFWEVVNEFDGEQLSRLLMFATSCSRPPLLGFKNLQPKFCIAKSLGDNGGLPTSATCANMLRLPVYKSKEELKEKLLIALKECEGFGLA